MHGHRNYRISLVERSLSGEIEKYFGIVLAAQFLIFVNNKSELTPR